MGSLPDDDALKLVLAFYCILEPEKQAQVLKLAEKYAAESRDLLDSNMSGEGSPF